MKFQTHEQIDNHYAAIGLDIPKLKSEHNQVKQILLNNQTEAISFLKRKMSKFSFWYWEKVSCFPRGPYLQAGFGADGYVEKAKEYGFKENTRTKVRFAMGLDALGEDQE